MNNWDLYITRLMGSIIEMTMLSYLFIYFFYSQISSNRRVKCLNDRGGVKLRRGRKWVWSGEAAHGSGFFSCHPFNCFLAVVPMTGLQGEQSCAHTHTQILLHTRAHVRSVLQYDRAAEEEQKWPRTLVAFHNWFTVSFPASGASITMYRKRFNVGSYYPVY